ncbi:MAG TPA: helicase RepA family protein [Candidatus Parabacteroides intestinigallinarum]|uniref:Helicase RepA family protein n=1 Tax=Candidatus Parabacteroides intestinigallinarum TaxID=2838722 RepID=A0A9D1XSY5_9BACT|nr:helicase RepA family protein [Candidatus Parabacteroides intestinigallinarum]
MGVNVLQELSAEQMKFKAEITEDKLEYRNHILDLSLPTNEPRFMFSIGGVPTIPQGELIGIKGRAKMGKSQFEYYLIAVMLASVSRGSVKPMQDHYKILLFDTEQSQVSLKKCCQRALKFAGLPTDKNDDRFLPFFMRPLSIEERRKVIDDAVEAEKPDIVFIDGVRDLLQDFNSLDQSNDLIQWLLSLTAEHGCTIVSVLHQNKSKDDGNMRGHLGSELLNKLTDCFEVSKKDGKFLVSCTDSRNVPCADLAFSIDAEGNFRTEEAIAEDKNSARAAEIQRVLKLCFKDKPSMRYGELVEAYQLEAAVSERTAKNHVKEAKDNNFIVVQNGLYSLAPK